MSAKDPLAICPARNFQPPKRSSMGSFRTRRKTGVQNKRKTCPQNKTGVSTCVAGFELRGLVGLVSGLLFGRNRVRRLHHFIHQLLELGEAGRGDDDGVAPAADVLRDAEKAPARIFLERKYKVFPLDLDFSAFERVFDDGWPGLGIFRRPVTLAVALAVALTLT